MTCLFVNDADGLFDLLVDMLVDMLMGLHPRTS